MDQQSLHNAPSVSLRTATLGMLLCMFLLAGCAAATNVEHLPRQPLSLNASEVLDMQYWTISYTVAPQAGSYRVRATALRKDNFPGWAEYVSTGWFVAYLADAQGNLLAQDTRSLYAGYHIPSWYRKNVDLEFTLPRPAQTAGPLSITFGYSLTLTDSRWGGSLIGPTQPLTGDRDYITIRETAR